MIVEYMMIDALYCGELDSLVNEALKKGWELYGTPFARGEVLNQAMVRKEVTE